MRLTEACIPTFARHETFHPRYGWLKKGYDAVLKDPRVFASETATVDLGVGKNMVRAIRFWGLASRVVCIESSTTSIRSTNCRPSRIGHALLADEGWDPYCEDPATLWLLHWWLLAPKSLLPVWWTAFHAFTAVEFGEDELYEFIFAHICSTPEWQSPHPSSVAKDLSCLLRTYCVVEEHGSRLEDFLDCPFRDLGILRRMPGEGKRLRFVVGAKPSLPPAVVLFASLDFIARTQGNVSQTITLSQLATEPGGPGRAFRLTESSFAQAMEIAVRDVPGLAVATPAGVPQLQLAGDPADLGSDVLTRYYARDRSGATDVFRMAGSDADAPWADPLPATISA